MNKKFQSIFRYLCWKEKKRCACLALSHSDMKGSKDNHKTVLAALQNRQLFPSTLRAAVVITLASGLPGRQAKPQELPGKTDEEGCAPAARYQHRGACSTQGDRSHFRTPVSPAPLALHGTSRPSVPALGCTKLWVSLSSQRNGQRPRWPARRDSMGRGKIMSMKGQRKGW